jgi:antitoxin component of MazEF toxin-antitoxin module
MDDYKKYALGQLENFLHDCMNAETTTAQEIYDVIKSVVEDNYYTYKNSASQAYELLALLNGNGKGHIESYDSAMSEKEHYESSMPPWGHSDMEYLVRQREIDKKLFACDKDDTTEECKKSWTSFWEESSQYTDEELNAMCDAAERQDKVKKWVLPVEECKDVDTDETEYFVSFPDDLLEAANLKEGDQIEWHDQGDGSFKLIKRETPPSWIKGNELAKVKTYQEMIDDGWSMTDDGFWIKEN